MADRAITAVVVCTVESSPQCGAFTYVCALTGCPRAEFRRGTMTVLEPHELTLENRPLE